MTSLTLVRRIAARPSIVFDALATAEGVAAWWGPDDLPVILATVIYASFFVVAANAVVDIVYAALDPRVRLA